MSDRVSRSRRCRTSEGMMFSPVNGRICTIRPFQKVWVQKHKNGSVFDTGITADSEA